jgi:hypothetical protein
LHGGARPAGQQRNGDAADGDDRGGGGGGQDAGVFRTADERERRQSERAGQGVDDAGEHAADLTTVAAKQT